MLKNRDTDFKIGILYYLNLACHFLFSSFLGPFGFFCQPRRLGYIFTRPRERQAPEAGKQIKWNSAIEPKGSTGEQRLWLSAMLAVCRLDTHNDEEVCQ